MKAFFAVALLCSFFGSSVLAPLEYEKNQRANLLDQNRRLVNKFPDPAIAQMAVPAQHKKD